MNKDKDIAQDLIDMAYRGARSIIARGEEVCPMGFVYVAEENAVAPLPMSSKNEAEKDANFSAFRKLCTDPMVTAYATITEAWMVSYTAEQPRHEGEPMPSQHPRREDCIQIIAQIRGGPMHLARAMITTAEGGTRQLGPCTLLKQDSAEGRAVNFFRPPETAH